MNSSDGQTAKRFPTSLMDWLTASSPDLALFSHFSTVCSTTGCQLGTQCHYSTPLMCAGLSLRLKSNIDEREGINSAAAFCRINGSYSAF